MSTKSATVSLAAWLAGVFWLRKLTENLLVINSKFYIDEFVTFEELLNNLNCSAPKERPFGI